MHTKSQLQIKPPQININYYNQQQPSSKIRHRYKSQLVNQMQYLIPMEVKNNEIENIELLREQSGHDDTLFNSFLKEYNSIRISDDQQHNQQNNQKQMRFQKNKLLVQEDSILQLHNKQDKNVLTSLKTNAYCIKKKKLLNCIKELRTQIMALRIMIGQQQNLFSNFIGQNLSKFCKSNINNQQKLEQNKKMQYSKRVNKQQNSNNSNNSNDETFIMKLKRIISQKEQQINIQKAQMMKNTCLIEELKNQNLQNQKQINRIKLIYDNQLNQLTNDKYNLLQQNFELQQKIESFNVELNQKLYLMRKSLQKQNNKKLQCLNSQIRQYAQSIQTLEHKIKQLQQQMQTKQSQNEGLMSKNRGLQQIINNYERQNHFTPNSTINNIDDKHRITQKFIFQNLQINKFDQGHSYEKVISVLNKSIQQKNQSINKSLKKQILNAQYQSNHSRSGHRRNYQNVSYRQYANTDYKSNMGSGQDYSSSKKYNQIRNYAQNPEKNEMHIKQSNVRYLMNNLTPKKYTSKHNYKYNINVGYPRIQLQLQNLSKQLKYELSNLGKKIR